MGCGASAKYEEKNNRESGVKAFEVLAEPTAKEDQIARHNLVITKAIDCKIDDFYSMKGLSIGKGGFGSVRKGVCKSTGAIRAIKSVAKDNTNAREFANEVEILRILDHPNIVRVYETYEDRLFYYVVMELCTGGELLDAIINCKGGFTEKVAANVMKQMVGAIAYLHSQRIAQRDLKPENFLLADESGIEKSSIIMVDFGLSTQFEGGKAMTSRTGTMDYVAPEVLQGSYTEKCDVWSLGVILYFMLSGKKPFEGSADRVSANIRRASYHLKGARWDDISQDAKGLIGKMIVLNVDDRLSAADVYNHSWVELLAPNAGAAKLPDDLLNNLKSFQAASTLEKAALAVMAFQLNNDAVKALKDTFNSLDKNGNGTISVNELKECINKHVEDKDRAATRELTELLDGIDVNGNQEIDYTEFLVSMMDKKATVQKEVCWSAFRVFDLDGNGSITKDELAKVMSGGHCEDIEQVLGIKRQEIEKIVAETDLDGDGNIDFEEFLKMMQHQTKQNVDSEVKSASKGSTKLLT